MQATSTSDETELVAFRAPVEHIERIRELAAEGDRTFSAELRRAIRAHIEAAEEQEAGTAA